MSLEVNSQSNSGKSAVFKTFPEFSKLTFADREVYETLIASYPPMADISFTTLMLWWNQLSSLAVSQLHGNLIISYWLPGDESNSGLSIIGPNKIDESVCTIFDYFKARGESPRLVHVPEFVMSHMRFPELFSFKEERGFDEYILPIARLYPLRHAVSYRRHRVQKFLARVDEEQIVVRSLDLSSEENQKLLLRCMKTWPRKGTINDLVKLSDEALEMAILQGDALGMENVCLFVDGQIHAYIMYSLPADKRYVIFSHAMVNYEIPYTFDYMTYAFANWFADQGITHVNLNMDLGVPMLRMVKLALGPENYFRKYTISPAVSA